MAGVRSALRAIAMIWLVTHSVALVSAPILLSLHSEEAGLECECVHGPNAICPMHHKPAKGANVCAIGSVDHGLATLGSLFYMTGLAPAQTKAAILTFAEPVSFEPIAVPDFHSVPPDPPPPRA